METDIEEGQVPFAQKIHSELFPIQGSISNIYLSTDGETGKVCLHKIVDFKKSSRYGGKTPLERARIMQRVHRVLSGVFSDHVATTQFLIARSSGREQVEVVQPYIDGVSPNLPNDVRSIHEYIQTQSGGREKLVKILMSKAKIPVYLARITADEITASTNWIKDNKSGKFVLVDF